MDYAILIRHGESEANVLKILDHDPDSKYHLTQIGRGQVEFTAERISKLKVDLILSSPLLRARETAEILSKKINVPYKVENGITEAGLGSFHVTGKKDYSTAMTRTVEFLNNEMRDMSGGYYTALDADSEGEEGRFYTWTVPELIRVLGEEDAALFSYVFGCTPDGNYHEEATGRLLGRNILFKEHNIDEATVKFAITEVQVEEIIERSRKKLKNEREKRIRPGRDEKIISDMNGLLLWALAKAYRVTNGKVFIESASGIAEFLSKKMIDGSGRILHRFSHSSAEIPGFVDDYAFCIAGFIELYQVSGHDEYLQTARKLQSYQDKNFWSKEGGYFNTEMTDAPVKLKEYHDGAIPSGNSFSLNNLLYFATVFGDPDMMNRAEELAESIGESITSSPFYSLFMICGIDFALGPSSLALFIILSSMSVIFCR